MLGCGRGGGRWRKGSGTVCCEGNICLIPTPLMQNSLDERERGKKMCIVDVK